MVPERLLGVPVLAETLVLGIVVHDVGVAFPTLVAFDAEVVFGFASQGTVARPRLKQTLRQSDRGWNLVGFHLADGDVFIGLDVFLRGDSLSEKAQRE